MKFVRSLIELIERFGNVEIGTESVNAQGIKYRYDTVRIKNERIHRNIVSAFDKALAEAVPHVSQKDLICKTNAMRQFRTEVDGVKMVFNADKSHLKSGGCSEIGFSKLVILNQ
jgi:hypothetical protein